MSETVFRRGDRVALCPIEEGDLDFLGRLRNDPEIRRGMTMVQPENRTRLQTWFEEHISETEGEGVQFLLGVATEPVGYLSLFDVERPADHCDMAYALAAEHRGRGYATEAVEQAVGYAVEELRLNKVAASVLASNDASRKVLERVGFQREGTWLREKFVGGERRDVHRYAVLADEWGED